ncbi:type IV pilus biogenesis protein PilP [Salmonella enterica]|uniref:Type IV pilus biogenesis protein PilP n=10 Tax=Salmonella enterica TaxID=28901 RepID=A0A5U3CTC5_SALDZ|nr:type IV pilus biogenesis protein PilP [Salmonella enterica]EAA7930790.1 type IV pilus biogenesis protein PilP [Salmonella enterica subsp. enterica serovar Redlands]EAB6033069.1 type IV pilus biogenesis protein PilP [Salmonella enterica subsp. enterica serovar Java]EAB8827274.1 type IV pilus biogenesis protein PilP [Salmonella enterica subsp. enterica serovar Infantis]EAB9740883.1 type IV pilus biogenesis protein PilP [Salmonella enterica subsp. diarizonae]EBH8951770.1 type IV pilus biogenes
MPVRNKAAMAAASTTAVLVLLVPLLTGSIRAQAAENVPSFAPTEATPPTAEETGQPEGSVPQVQTPVTDSVPPVAPPGSITLGMLEHIQQKNLLLAAQVQTAQLKRQLEEAGSDTPAAATIAPSAPGLTVPSQGAGLPDSTATSRGPGRPQVLEISGKGSALYAVLQMPDGSRPEVTRGSRVTIGKATLTVSRVSLSGITLSDGSALPF